jgi:hypothetical protein
MRSSNRRKACLEAIVLKSILVLVLAAAAHLPATAGDSAAPESRSVVALLADPAAFHEKRVRTLGFYVLAEEESALYLSAGDAEHGIYANSVWVDGEGSSVDLAGVSGRYVLVEGTFNARNKGHGSLAAGGIESVSRIVELPPRESKVGPAQKQ